MPDKKGNLTKAEKAVLKAEHPAQYAKDTTFSGKWFPPSPALVKIHQETKGGITTEMIKKMQDDKRKKMRLMAQKQREAKALKAGTASADSLSKMSQTAYNNYMNRR